MKRINSRTVEFTSVMEIEAHDRFHQALDEGASVCQAARVALEEGIATGARPRYTAAFVEYLSEGTLICTRGGRVVTTPKGRQFP